MSHVACVMRCNDHIATDQFRQGSENETPAATKTDLNEARKGTKPGREETDGARTEPKTVNRKIDLRDL